jgi:type VI secretion system protein ImpC
MSDEKRPSGKIEFDVTFGTRAKPVPRNSDSPFCLVVLGDFSGRACRSLVEPVAPRRPLSIDVDNFDRVIEKMGVALRLSSPEADDRVDNLKFASLEDFHPDEVIKQLPALSKLLELRKRLQNPATAGAAAAELQGLMALPLSSSGSAPISATPVESNEDTLARLMGNSPAPQPAPIPATGKVDINHLIKSIVAPSVVPHLPARQTGVLTALELELTTRLRAVLHHPQFQALEAAWRSVDFLVRNLDAEENLKLYLLDVSKAELAADLKTQAELQSSGIYSVLYGQPWAAILADYSFDESLEDLEMLRSMATISSWLGAPFIAAASPHLVGCESFGLQPDPNNWTRPMPPESKQAWQALRQMPEAGHLGLALPRFLIRQPYGKGSDEIEAFPFEELPAPDSHESYLWGNPAFLCGYVLAESFKENGWDLDTSGGGEIRDLPVYNFKEDGETQVKPCAEAWLTIRAADRVLEQGLIPVLSIKGRDAVRLAALQSLAEPARALALTGKTNS